MTDTTSHRANVEDAATETPASVHPGFWMTVLGGILAVLGPLAGFLGGSVTSSTGEDRTSMIATWLAAGLGAGALGVLLVALGGLRWWRSARGASGQVAVRR
jgi:hypothetical protein